MTTRDKMMQLIDDFATTIRDAERGLTRTSQTPEQFKSTLEAVSVARRRLDSAITEALRRK